MITKLCLESALSGYFKLKKNRFDILRATLLSLFRNSLLQISLYQEKFFLCSFALSLRKRWLEKVALQDFHWLKIGNRIWLVSFRWENRITMLDIISSKLAGCNSVSELPKGLSLGLLSSSSLQSLSSLSLELHFVFSAFEYLHLLQWLCFHCWHHQHYCVKSFWLNSFSLSYFTTHSVFMPFATYLRKCGSDNRYWTSKQAGGLTFS